MITRQQFEEAFKKLQQTAPRRKEVLENVLKGCTDDEIAASMKIHKGTVRKQVEIIYKAFSIQGEFEGDRRPRRNEIIALFKTYKPEMVEVQEESNSTPTPSPELLTKNDSFRKNVDFLGREEAIQRLNDLVDQGEKLIGIYGKGGVGKTKLARQFFKQNRIECWEIFVGRQSQYITPVEQKIWSLLYPDTPYNPEFDFQTLLHRFNSVLKERKIGILIDNLEPALQKGKLLENHHRYVDLLILLSHPDVKSITLITSRECLKESKVRVADAYYGLPGLEKTEWQEFFNYYQIKTDSPAFHKLYEAYGGNTKAMEILCGAIRRPPFNRNLDAYYQENKEDLLIEGELEDLVASQFDHLSKNDEDAYKLLCRLGIYSYQNTEFLPSIALNIVLWDVPKSRVKRVIKYLQDCFLIETQADRLREGKFYLKDIKYQIHPVILSEALSRLYSCTETFEDIVFLMKQEIEVLVKNDTDIQITLKTVGQKSEFIFNKINKIYKIASIRSFYFSHSFLYFTTLYVDDLVDSRVLSTIIDRFFPWNIGLAWAHGNVPQEIQLDNALSLGLSFYSEILYILQESDESKNYMLDTPTAGCSECFSTSLDYTSNEKLKSMLLKIAFEILDSWRYLKTLKEWWIDKGIDMVKELQEWTIENRGIGYCFDFSEEQQQILHDYYEANLIFVKCLNSLPDISPEVREEIEETLLLPIEEIEKWKQQHRPNS
ncbi:NACHT C-terminal helical domain 2-containing protein [Limnoraphis robusta]|uniref:NB-ARC domain-containing protein n=1 Tax=Limnoraphis robusta CCNP1315 TaxID=3110306 RepID=A0ABU5U6C2_9CYAN|nr:NB-ARC domain-containing protein [Limnoraphis robusta]MEA5522540.1 NB-ARC domain-containing protein [Limnoraphis robusta CCNP1315]MEA5548283.1 NB-ARC domain-containing protein [Limnoraphis robusta CCNP1324]